MYKPNDILIRKTAEGDTIWVSQRLIVEICGVSEEYIRYTRTTYKQSLPKSWSKVAEKSEFYLGDTGKSWRWGRKNGQHYYDYDRVPNRAPVNYRSMLPTKDELVEFVEDNNLRGSRERATSVRNILLEAVDSMQNNADANWINTTSGYQIDIATAREYAKALAWCRLIKATVSNNSMMLFEATTIAAFYELCVDVLKTLNIKNLRLNTVKSLRNKIATFPNVVDDQRRWIVSGKYGNYNSQKVGKTRFVDYETGVIYPFDIHQAIMHAAYMNMDGPEKETLKALYEGIYIPLISEFGIDSIDYRTFCSHLSRFSTRLKTDRQRHGDDYYKKKLLTYIPSEKLQYAHSLFCGDGSGLFGYRYINPEGELKIMNLYAILITDVATGYIAGWSVAPEGSHKETPIMARNAVRMAAMQADKQTMFEFVTDNHGAFTETQNKEYFSDVFNVVRTIERGNSQANPAEMMFRLFKGAVLRGMKEFIRSSHYATTTNRANTDKICKEEYPDYNMAIELLQERISVWNNNPRMNKDKSPAELFVTNKNPKCEQLDDLRLRKIFGIRTPIEVSRGRGFVKVGAKNREILFEIPDYINSGSELISRATGNGYYSNVEVYYDNVAADLYSADGKFIISCPRVDSGTTAHAERDDQKRANQQRLKERKEQQYAQVIKHENNISEAMSAISNLSLGYEADVKFGGDKESINEAYEGLINIEIKSKQQKEAQNGLIKVKRKELKQQEKEQSQVAYDMQSRHSALLKRRLPEIYK